MVQLEEVEDAELDQAQPGPVGDDYESDDDFVDTGMRIYLSCLLLRYISLQDRLRVIDIALTFPTPRFRALRRRPHFLRPTL